MQRNSGERKLRTDALNRKILDLMPLDGSYIRAKSLYAKAEAQGLWRLTVENKLKEFEKKGFVSRRQESPKAVYYSRRERVRIEHLIDDFVKDIRSTLDRLPAEIDGIETLLREMDRSTPVSTRKQIATTLRNNPKFLKGKITATLLRRVLKMLNDDLPEQLRGHEFYVGAFDDCVRMIPRDFIKKANLE